MGCFARLRARRLPSPPIPPIMRAPSLPPPSSLPLIGSRQLYGTHNERAPPGRPGHTQRRVLREEAAIGRHRARAVAAPRARLLAWRSHLACLRPPPPRGRPPLGLGSTAVRDGAQQPNSRRGCVGSRGVPRLTRCAQSGRQMLASVKRGIVGWVASRTATKFHLRASSSWRA
jgi:hypothetical protein